MTTFILSEKPSAALRIATALADKDIERKSLFKVPYYEITHKNEKIIVACAVGHLYAIAEKERKGWIYPVFDVTWKASYEIKGLEYTKPYLDTISALSSKADKFVVATDYDIEGSVLGLNIIRYACNKSDAKRMKFSTLTKEELIDSYKNASKTLDWGQALAGETRHILDWIFGINLSRALTLSLKTAGVFKILTTGRVQGPTLNLIYQKENEIKSFKSEPYWEIEAITPKLTAKHKKGRFKEKPGVILKKIKGKDAIVKSLIKRALKIIPPAPFDLTTLQIEAYRCFGFSPTLTLSIAQKLYISGLISYPRTSSQKLPPAINYKKILSSLSKQLQFTKNCLSLLKSKLTPYEGKKTDPAHPAIYPTGIQPKALEGRIQRLYDLIVSRFLATFSTPAELESISILLEINKEPFIATGSTIAKKGWFDFYPYARIKETELPVLKEGQKLKVKKINLLEKKTQPPKRYTEASLIKELEKRTLGTKGTRAQVIESLYHRNFIKDRAIQITTMGESIITTLKKYCPEILDEELTRHFEEDMEKIMENKKEQKSIIDEAKKFLIKIFTNFKKKEIAIGKSLLESYKETRREERYIGSCPVCKKGNLRLLFSKKTKKQFIACDQYPKCKTTFPVPPNALIKNTDEVCKECNYPVILVIRKERRPWKLCINMKCPTKKNWKKPK